MTALQAQTNAKPQKTGPKSIMIAQQIKKQTSKQDLDMDKENFNSNRKTQQELLQVSQVIEKSKFTLLFLHFQVSICGAKWVEQPEWRRNPGRTNRTLLLICSS